MKKILKQKPQKENSIDILKKVAKRVEEATVDISSMKHDLKFMNARLGIVEHNTEVMKVDMEKMRNEMVEVEMRLGKRISNVADLITTELGGKLQNHEKRIKKLEHIQQSA